VLNYGLSTKGWWAIPIGLVYSVVYYGLFRFFIRKFNMATPGREPAAADEQVDSFSAGGFVSPVAGAAVPRAQRYIAALGGAANLSVVDACTTRLRLSVVDPDKVSESELKTIGARGVLKRGASAVQVIIGPEADIIADEIRAVIAQGGEAATPVAAVAKPVAAAPAPVAKATAGHHGGPLDPDPLRWLAVFGGAGNVASLDAVASTRLRIVVRDPSAVDRQRLAALDTAWVSADTFHIVVGDAAQRYADTLATRMSQTGGATPLPA
jgi:N-acetylglucosamine PTS system EIICBA or EIICB component